MNQFQRLKGVFAGILILIFAIVIMLVPEEGYDSVASVISILLLLYGFRLLWYYFSMARHMVGGKSTLYQAVIILDLALFTGSIASMNSFIILVYLLGVFAFSGMINVLRAFEARRVGGSWKSKLFTGCIGVLFALLSLILGMILGDRSILVYGFSISLIYAGMVRIINAFRKTAIAYFQ